MRLFHLKYISSLILGLDNIFFPMTFSIKFKNKEDNNIIFQHIIIMNGEVFNINLAYSFIPPLYNIKATIYINENVN